MTYTSTISTATALAPDLRAAGGDYPDWVVKRYLQLPASTTDRTRQLAKELENGQVPYDAAVTIQNWLHDNITYNSCVWCYKTRFANYRHFIIYRKN